MDTALRTTGIIASVFAALVAVVVVVVGIREAPSLIRYLRMRRM